MITGSFRVGQRLQRQTVPYRVERDLGGGCIVLENLASGRYEEKSISDLLGEWNEGRLILGDAVKPADDTARELAVRGAHLDLFRQSYTKKQQAEARAKLFFVEKLEKAPRTAEVMVPQIHETWTKYKRALKAAERVLKAEPHFTSVARWIKRYLAAGRDIRVLISRHDDKGSRVRRINQDVERDVDDLIETRFLTKERPTLKKIRDELKGLVAQRNATRLPGERLTCPSYAYLKRYVQALPQYDVCCARYGQRIADIKFRTAGQGVDAPRALARAAMDHTRLDLFVVDERTRLPLGRPWLTVIIDECTRYILGYYVSFEPPSGVSTARALRHAITPKHTSAGIRTSWDAWGAMEVLVVDNGLEFHSDALEFGCGRLGITIEFCPRRKPWFKGKIERYFGTVSTGLLSDMKGKTFSNTFLKEDYNPAKHAVLTLATFRQVLEIWVADVYHQTIHSALDQSPQQAWEELAPPVDRRRLPASSIEVEAAFSRTEQRKLTHKGIELDSLLYNSPALGALREQYGSEMLVEVRIRDDDLSGVIVVAYDSKTLITVPALEVEYTAGLTRWQHKVCKRYRRRKAEDDGREISLLAARQAIRKLIEKDMQLASPSGTRVREQRFLQGETTGSTVTTVTGDRSDKAPPKALPPPLPEPPVTSDIWPDVAADDEIPELPSHKRRGTKP